MDSGVLTAIVMALSAVIVAGIGGMYTYRASRRNSEATRAIEKDKLSTESWKEQVKAWREDVVTLRQQRAEDNRTFESHQSYCKEQVDELTKKVDELKRQRNYDEERRIQERQAVINQFKAITVWGRAVVALLTEAGIPFPPPPPGTLDTNPRIPRVS